jgi:hypothetical protein
VLEVFVPRWVWGVGLWLLWERAAAGAPARLYVVPDDFAYRLQVATQYDLDAARPYLERGILAVPAAAWGGRAVAVGRLPSAVELLALAGRAGAGAPVEAQQLPAPPVEVFELAVEPEASPLLGAPEPRVSGLTEEGLRFLEEAVRRSDELLSSAPPRPPAPAPENQQLPEEAVVVVEDAVKLAATREAAAGEGEGETAPSRPRSRRKKRKEKEEGLGA